MPALTRFYGLKPGDLDAMTRREIQEYLIQMQQSRQQSREE